MFLGLQSDYAITHLNCSLEEREHYWVLKTPDQPFYYFGNLLAFKSSIANVSFDAALEQFKHEFQNMPDVKHQTIIWPRSDENEQPTVEQYLAAGFKFDETHILAATQNDLVLPATLTNQVSYKELTTDDDWNQWKKLSVATNPEYSSQDNYDDYLNGQISNYKALEDAGHGYYLGAFKKDKLVGYAGLYQYKGLARFQNVAVDEQHRNQGVAKSLLSQLIKDSPTSTQHWVIQADENYYATLLYQSMGFKVMERVGELCRS